MPAGTVKIADAGTADIAEEIYMPPCRAAALEIAPCPLCGRLLRIKTLTYSHQCKRSFHLNDRVTEQRTSADKAILQRMGHSIAHQVEQARELAHPIEQLREKVPNNYACLFKAPRV